MTPGSGLRLRIGCLIASSAVLAAHVEAQSAREGAAGGVGWLARTGALEGFRSSAAEKAYALARLEEIEGVFLEVPEIRNPAQFELGGVVSGFYARARAPGANTTLEYRYELVTTTVAQFLDHKACSVLQVTVNASPPAPSFVDEKGRDIVVEKPRGDSIPGASVVLERLSPTERSFEEVIFTPGGRSPWIQLTREEFRKVQIFDAEGRNGEKLAEFRKSREKTRYEDWMDGAVQRRKEREELATTLKGSKSATEIADMIREMEKTEREVTAQLKAEEDDDRRQNQEFLNTPGYGDKLRASLAAMSPAERKLPAFVAPGGEVGYDFVLPDAPFAQRVLTPDPGFWRARRSPVEVHSISVLFQASCGSAPPPPQVHRALWRMHEKMDWAALRRILERP